MRATHQRLYVNVDHVATLRQVRRAMEPDPAAAAAVCENSGADGITAHLREDRRHIQDEDIHHLVRNVRTVLNLEMALTEEMLALAEQIRPHQVTLVPERREEITTEGGLDVRRDSHRIADGLARLKRAGIRSSLFIDPDAVAVKCSHDLGADAIELHTGSYANEMGNTARIVALRDTARLGAELGLAVHAGHGLTVSNVGAVAELAEVEELNIGHSIIARAIFIGLPAAVREMRSAMDEARGGW